MPISYKIDEDRGLVLTTATGTLTDADILSLKALLAADPRWRPGMRELSDVRGVERLDVTTAGVRQMAAWDAAADPAIGQYRLAIVASRDHVFGMARMYEMLTDQSVPGVSVFRDIDEAIRWLNTND
jgi:hypothetical protein